ncbi:hypothetical protein DM02DRAFT_372878 [Periconia macrospinosa]|uniref:Uncharacterized protein n=1 Tax=Periconia macrospinosa TaxID=97972 RepID=A0A2V1CZ92_9PLEO|nr:hypothetical protein DM02DRAFT_372878 [Periconia macrospinosa]
MASASKMGSTGVLFHFWLEPLPRVGDAFSISASAVTHHSFCYSAIAVTPLELLICKPCGFAVAPSHLSEHIAKRHGNDACRAAGLDPTHRKPRKLASTLAAALQERYAILNPRHTRIPVPLPTDPPLPELKRYLKIKYKLRKLSNCTVMIK